MAVAVAVAVTEGGEGRRERFGRGWVLPPFGEGSGGEGSGGEDGRGEELDSDSDSDFDLDLDSLATLRGRGLLRPLPPADGAKAAADAARARSAAAAAGRLIADEGGATNGALAASAFCVLRSAFTFYVLRSALSMSVRLLLAPLFFRVRDAARGCLSLLAAAGGGGRGSLGR